MTPLSTSAAIITTLLALGACTSGSTPDPAETTDAAKSERRTYTLQQLVDVTEQHGPRSERFTLPAMTKNLSVQGTCTTVEGSEVTGPRATFTVEPARGGVDLVRLIAECGEDEPVSALVDVPESAGNVLVLRVKPNDPFDVRWTGQVSAG